VNLRPRWRVRAARVLVPAAAAAIGMTPLAACSSGSTTATAAASSSASPAISASVGVKYAGGGTVGKKATGTPITIGWVNQQGGTPSYPEGTVAFDAAITYINDQLDGIDGHPITIVSCYIVASTQQAQECGEQMVDNSSVVAIALGSTSLGNEEFHQTVDGKKPVIEGNANPGPDLVSANTYALNSGAISGVVSSAAYAKQIGASSASVIADNQPSDQVISQNIGGAIQRQGIKVDYAYFPVNSTDLTSAVEAAKIGSTSISVPGTVSPPECIAYAQTVKQLEITEPTLAASSCVTSNLKAALGDYPDFDYTYPYLNINAADATGQVAFYKAVMAKYAGAGAQLGIDAPYNFGQAFAIARMLNSAAAPYTAASVEAAAKAFTGPVLLGPTTEKWGQVIPGDLALGSGQGRIYSYRGNGDWVAVSGWIGS
jgi:branched-chain amino acid transport system substrate-binding protein